MIRLIKGAYRKAISIVSHQIINAKIRKSCDSVIRKYKKLSDSDEHFEIPKQIWVLWWQREMPKVAEACINQICKLEVQGYRVTLLNKDNYMKYTEIPPRILFLYQEKKLSLTFLADVIRINLLNTWGGVWIDATFLITGTLPDMSDFRFYSLHRRDSIKNTNIAHKKYSAYFLAAAPGDICVSFVWDVFSEWFQFHDEIPDYFFIDYAFWMGYKNIQRIRNEIDALPVVDDVFELCDQLNCRYNGEIYKELCAKSFGHKLSYKKDWQIDMSGEYTFYKKILEDAHVTV